MSPRSRSPWRRRSASRDGVRSTTTSAQADALRDEKVKVLKSIRPIDPDHLVRGQYAGYRDEPGVEPDSDTETYAALRLDLDSWRWSGGPFYIRTGKGLPTTPLAAV